MDLACPAAGFNTIRLHVLFNQPIRRKTRDLCDLRACRGLSGVEYRTDRFTPENVTGGECKGDAARAHNPLL